MTKTPKKPTLLQALIPIIVLIAMLSVNVLLMFKDDALSGSNQIILLFAAAVVVLIAMSRLGYDWETIQDGIVKTISTAMPSILIMLMIGALTGTWLISGIVPAMIYYGLDFLNPKVFLLAACVISAIVSMATGSSWTTIGTIGVALLGIGKALGFSEGIVAGAIISGGYFGDKLSPMSETTNLAPAVAGTDLFTHIRSMMKTNIPTFSITIVIFTILGFMYDAGEVVHGPEVLQAALASKFDITPLLFIVPAFVLVLIVKKAPALPALFLGMLLGCVFAAIFQPGIIAEIGKGIVDGREVSSLTASAIGAFQAMFGDVSITTDNAQVNDLLSSGGMAGMMNTIWLIICAMVFGGAMEASGMLSRISEAIISKAQSTGSLITSTVGSCFFFNLTASDQYLAIVVPGKMFADAYRKRGIGPEVLSRSLEDAGTVTSVLIPWNTCGAYQSNVLGVATWAYLPYCFFNWLSPIVNIIFGYLFVKAKEAVNPGKVAVERVED
ncbi:sodium:proton antiporter [Fulvitalea axinellae]|uniref:Sodium:proton antiporter n=1 Tax=Fulvitalea axinellae TaxID=1182444 RepID=A0AAU9DFF7_9BACT|nr:sodium:proton antiporter [Fulvitalea axinellae]